MNFHDLSALDFSRNKWNMTYECTPELVVTVPAGCNSWKLSTHSLLTFITEFLSAVVKISQHYAWLFHDFPGFSMTFAVFHDYPGLEYGLPKLYDFPGPVVTLKWKALHKSTVYLLIHNRLISQPITVHCFCSWRPRITEQFSITSQRCGLIVQWVLVVTKYIFVQTVEPRCSYCSVSHFNCAA